MCANNTILGTKPLSAAQAGALVSGPAERVGGGFAPHLEHLSSAVSSGLAAVGRDIELNYNGTVR
jgi:hypothetical protein